MGLKYSLKLPTTRLPLSIWPAQPIKQLLWPSEAPDQAHLAPPPLCHPFVFSSPPKSFANAKNVFMRLCVLSLESVQVYWSVTFQGCYFTNGADWFGSIDLSLINSMQSKQIRLDWLPIANWLNCKDIMLCRRWSYLLDLEKYLETEKQT